jgi:hypothetical protein
MAQNTTGIRPTKTADTDTPPTVQGTPVATARNALDEVKAALGGVTVTHGDQSSTFDLAGETVKSVRDHLKDAFSIHPDAKAYVDGQLVTGEHVLTNGCQIEFLKESGTKGTSPP